MSTESPKFGGDADSEKIKKELNEEGWEGKAAVHVGTRRELDQARERLESEGRAADLGTYLKMHKEIMLSQDDPEMAHIKGAIGTGKGEGCLEYSKDHFVLRYVDKDGNVASTDIYPEDIAELKLNIAENFNFYEAKRLIQTKLGELGFSFGKELSRFLSTDFDAFLNEKRQRLEKESEEKAKGEFDF